MQKPIVVFYSNLQISKRARNLFSFIVPKNKNLRKSSKNITNIKIVAIIPTYKPTYLTFLLIKNLSTWHKDVIIIVVNDSSLKDSGWYNLMFKKIKILSRNRKMVHYAKTPNNLLKAGALNYGFLYSRKITKYAQVVLTFDDDVTITKKTIPTLVDKLYSSSNLGAVCSSVRVKNKNKNIITRLQGLEYHNFNVTKIADNGFFRGPLVMQGMITAFKARAFNKVGGFCETNLIEDYEITANIKSKKWNVAFAQNCWAWTNVPERFSTLWRQRVRWTYGGLTVFQSYYKNPSSIIQDFIGHVMFITLFVLIALSLLLPSVTTIHKSFVIALLMVAFINFFISYLFSMYTMRYYKNADWKDYVIRLIIFPELIYSNLLALILLGSYFFYTYNVLFSKILRINHVYNKGLYIFNKVGYSLSWGTRK